MVLNSTPFYRSSMSIRLLSFLQFIMDAMVGGSSVKELIAFMIMDKQDINRFKGARKPNRSLSCNTTFKLV